MGPQEHPSNPLTQSYLEPGDNNVDIIYDTVIFGAKYFKNSFNSIKKCFTIKIKTKEVLQGDEAQPNKSLVCNLGSMLTTKKPLAWSWRSII